MKEGRARHSVRAADSNPFADRRARSDAPCLTYIEIFFVTILKREPLEIKNPLHHPGGCQQRDDCRAESERQSLINPRTAQTKSQRQKGGDNRELPELDTQIESDQSQGQGWSRQAEVNQHVGEAEPMHQPEAKSHDPAPLPQNGSNIV